MEKLYVNKFQLESSKNYLWTERCAKPFMNISNKWIWDYVNSIKPSGMRPQYWIFNCWAYFCIQIRNNPQSTVILREYFENIPLKSCNIARIFIKLLERFLKYHRNLEMSVQNVINGIVLQY